jgi:hypothetical protein
MYQQLFQDFLESSDTLRVFKGYELIFSSSKERLLPLLEYIDSFSVNCQQVVIFDKIMGNAAALLSVKAGGEEVYSPLGSQLAVGSLEKYRIKYHLAEIVPYIQRPDSEEMCPMEHLSIGKEPEEFYEVIRNTIK